MDRDNLKSRWRMHVATALGMAALLAVLASPSLATQRRRPMNLRSVLHARRIARAQFGMWPAGVVRRIDHLLRHRPTESLHIVHACGVDHAIGWPGLVVFFRANRFVGYSYRPAYGTNTVPTLATARGLRVGDTLTVGKTLYGREFHASRHHGGTWWAWTAEGRLEGLASGWPGGPRGSVATIAAGNVGCPSSTP